jgi:predicted Zn-dependent protease
MVTIPLPSILRRAQIVPYLFFMVFILIFARMVFERYEADKNYFEGDLLNFRGDRATASGKFDEALVHNPHHSLARFYAAANLIKAGKYAEARDHIKFFLKEYPYYPKAHLMLALSSFELGDTATAQSELNAEMTIDASPQTLYIASYFAFRLNKKDKELQTLQSLLEQNVKSGISDYAAQSIGRLTELCDDRLFQSTYHELMLRLQEKFPSDLPILTAIGECLIKFDQVKEAKSIVDRALALNPNDPMFAQRLRVLKEKLEAGTAH